MDVSDLKMEALRSSKTLVKGLQDYMGSHPENNNLYSESHKTSTLTCYLPTWTYFPGNHWRNWSNSQTTIWALFSSGSHPISPSTVTWKSYLALYLRVPQYSKLSMLPVPYLIVSLCVSDISAGFLLHLTQGRFHYQVANSSALKCWINSPIYFDIGGDRKNIDWRYLSDA
jgi:hypothetical protein